MMLSQPSLFLIYKLRILVNRRFFWTKKCITAFCECFDLSRNEFYLYRAQTQILPLDAQYLEEISELREKMNIPKKDWLQYPVLLKQSTRYIEQNYTYLKEGGFENIDAKVLANCSRVVHKTINYLKNKSYIPVHVNVAESFVKHLDPVPHMFIDNLTDNCNFTFVHHAILTQYLMWKFNTSKDAIEQFFRSHSLSKMKSFQALSHNFKLADRIGYTPDDMFKYGPLLKSCPEATERLLTQLPTLAGVDICEVLKVRPRIVRKSLDQILQIYNCLQEANISDDSIRRYLNIFYLLPETVAMRIQEAKKIPEFRLIRDHPSFLKLIICHNEVRSRLSFLNQLQSKCTSIETLCCHKEKFDDFVQEGSDKHSQTEVLSFIKRLTESESNEIGVNLRKNSFHRHVPLKVISDNYKYLRDLNFSNEAIINVVQVLLYPRNKLEGAYEHACDYIKGNVNQIEKLNLILYFMEKEYHFTGDGIWNDTENA